MDSLDIGLHFLPSDEELLRLLKIKASGKGTNPSRFVLERFLYGADASPWKILDDNVPWEIEGDCGRKGVKKTVHVFTKLSHMSVRKIARRAGCGTWSGETKAKEVKNKKGEILGYKKMFKFEVKRGSKEKAEGHWIMHEYSLAGGENENTDDVVCKISRFDPISDDQGEDEICTTIDPRGVHQESAKRESQPILEDETSRPRKTLKNQFQPGFSDSTNCTVESHAEASELPNLVSVDQGSTTNNGLPTDEKNVEDFLELPTSGSIVDGSTTNYQASFTGALMDGQSDEDFLNEIVDFSGWDRNGIVEFLDPFFLKS